MVPNSCVFSTGPHHVTNFFLVFLLLNKYEINIQQKRVSFKQPMNNFSLLASDFHDFNQEK